MHITGGAAYAAPVALPHAILVSLCEQSGSGYELARRFDRSIGFFWAATHQQIYRTLRAMEDDGWVHVTEVEQHGRPDKKVYRASDAGRAELARWIAAPLVGRGGRGGSLADSRTRDLAVKIRGAEHGDVAALHGQVVALRASVPNCWTPTADSRRASSRIRAPSPAPTCISTWCCAVASAPRRAPSNGSTK